MLVQPCDLSLFCFILLFRMSYDNAVNNRYRTTYVLHCIILFYYPLLCRLGVNVRFCFLLLSMYIRATEKWSDTPARNDRKRHIMSWDLFIHTEPIWITMTHMFWVFENYSERMCKNNSWPFDDSLAQHLFAHLWVKSTATASATQIPVQQSTSYSCCATVSKMNFIKSV